MGRLLHHKKSNDTYALYSTITDDYVTPWGTKKEIHDLWLLDMIEEAIDKVDKYMEQIDEEVDG